MKNPPILISVLGFFALLAGFWYMYLGLRLIGFDFFGAFSDSELTQGYWFWGAMEIIVGVIYVAAALALWALQPWAWMFAIFLSVFALVSAFFVMLDAGFAAGLGSALLPLIILWYLNTAQVKEAFGMDTGA